MPTPPAQVNYGIDISCTWRTNTLEMPDGSFQEVTGFDFTPDLAVVTGRAGLAEAEARRINTYPGTLCDDRDYGIDIGQWLNDDVSPRDLARLSARVDAETTKDERVISSSTNASFIGGVLILPINLVDVAGPFPLTIAVGQVSLQILLGAG